jgi:hypothetical protein
MHRLALGLALLTLVFAGCGEGSETVSKPASVGAESSAFSQGARLKAVPQLHGRPLRAAKEVAGQAGFDVREAGCPDYGGDPRGLAVLAQEPPARTRVPEGSMIGVRLTKCAAG